MTEWEYLKINLNQHPPRGDELDLLNAAGAEGWELVGITSNNTAYLRRQIEGLLPAAAQYEGTTQSAADTRATSGAEVARSGHEVKAKYRDPATNETWSGRGRMANWLKSKQDAGEDIEHYLVSSTAASKP